MKALMEKLRAALTEETGVTLPSEATAQVKTDADSAKQRFEQRRKALKTHYCKEASGWYPPGGKNVANPHARNEDYTRLDRLHKGAKSLDWENVIGFGFMSAVVAAIVTILSYAAMLQHPLLNGLIALAIALFITQSGYTFAAARRYAYLKEQANRVPRTIKVSGADENLHRVFHEAVAKIRSLNPPTDTVEAVVEAQDRFDGLILTAEEFFRADLAYAEAALATRTEMASLTADAVALREVLQNRRSVELALESTVGQHAVERARSFAGLAGPASNVIEETVMLDAYLKQIAPSS